MTHLPAVAELKHIRREIRQISLRCARVPGDWDGELGPGQHGHRREPEDQTGP